MSQSLPDSSDIRTPRAEETAAAAVRDRLGRPLCDLRLSVIDQCNMRCPYCMPSEVYGPGYAFLRGDEMLSFEEIERVVRAFVCVGVRKVKITGGEPLLRPLLPDLIRRLAGLPGIEDLALITNGLLLERMAAPLARAGLSRVTVSLDSLRPDTFGRLSGRGRRLEQVLAGLRSAAEAGLTPVKLNCVLLRGINDDEALDLVRFARDGGFVLRFIEYMDVGGARDWQRGRVVSSAELIRRIGAGFPIEPMDPTRPGEVATRYAFADGGGEIGFISSVSSPFCADCSRGRLSADGKLFTCLFAESGHDLKGLLRSGAGEPELASAVRRLWGGRSDRYSELREERRSAGAKVDMHYVGG